MEDAIQYDSTQHNKASTGLSSNSWPVDLSSALPQVLDNRRGVRQESLFPFRLTNSILDVSTQCTS